MRRLVLRPARMMKVMRVMSTKWVCFACPVCFAGEDDDGDEY
jgi:hypothetical protein